MGLKTQVPKLWMAHLALLAVALFYGVNYFTLKAVLSLDYNPFAVLAIRCTVALAFFWGMHALFSGERVKSRADYLRLLVCAVFGVTINQSLFISGMAETSKVNASVLMITTPVFVFLAAALLKEERITPRKLSGLVLSLTAAVALILTSASAAFSFDESNALGDVMITVNAASYGLYLVLVRPLLQRYDTFTVTKWLFIFGGIPNIMMGLGPALRTEWAAMPGQAWFGIAFLIFGATFAAYFLNAWAMKRLPSSAPAAYIYLQPVFVSIGSLLIGESELNGLKGLLMLGIALGVWLITGQAGKAKAKT